MTWIESSAHHVAKEFMAQSSLLICLGEHSIEKVADEIFWDASLCCRWLGRLVICCRSHRSRSVGSPPKS